MIETENTFPVWLARRTLRSSAFVAGLVICSSAAIAESDAVDFPEGCTPTATVLKSACQATTILDCKSHREAHTFQNGNYRVIHIYDRDWQLTEFRFAEMNGVRMTAVQDTLSNTHLHQLLQDGETAESGQFLLNTGMIKDRAYTLEGRVTLSNDTVELGGATFRTGRIRRTFERSTGGGEMAFEIDLFVSTDPDLLIEGSWQRSVAGGAPESFDQTPLNIAWPGEQGFLATRSEVGCD